MQPVTKSDLNFATQTPPVYSILTEVISTGKILLENRAKLNLDFYLLQEQLE
ncbi:hypothetical protein [Bacillus tuaregi]|uniref:hypothetical protein n=1 Tax=Bacillus tuaregi TaxID=1816695 RepID=UPI00135666C9|nr:hypothetical protein [Bacillus tuaregi]